MNKLGLKNTHFQTVHGLDAEGQYSSARDMALIGSASTMCLKNTQFIKRKSLPLTTSVKQTAMGCCGIRV
ncbi:hypothetical protein J4727_20940 [Providencia rettgeri]|uniref:Peptidase S11 D-alanyl-D-alanine carboxypeptidase A N-terminal domain-containing protein n=1 Tax=Providencia rettgeri TaxID=587 RepID=A0A939NIE7_PRORE|nr:hypothetical protein [Providencia rettgeri]